jgi:hypothetical protein
MLILVSISCQNNPNINAVHTKTAITEGTETVNNKLIVPEKYKANLSSDDKKFKVIAEAQVILPEADDFPVIKVSKDKITQDYANKIIKEFYGSNPIYEQKTAADLTKDEITEEIVRLKSGEDSDLAVQDKEAYLESIELDIEKLEEMYEKAPEEYHPKLSDGLFKKYTTNDDSNVYYQSLEAETVTIEGESLDGYNANLFIYRDRTNNGYFEFVNKRETFEFSPGKGATTSIDIAKNLPTISINDAQKAADEIVNSLGFESFELIDYCSVLAGYNVDYSSYDNMQKCYAFHYARNYGLPINYTSNQVMPTFNQVWKNELLTVYVDDYGIIGVAYTSPTKIDEVVNNSIALMPFEDIVKIFEEQIFLSNQWQEDSIEEQIFYIEKIKLGLAKVISENKYYYIPVWDFYGRWYTKYKNDESMNAEHTKTEYGYSYFTINANDGSVINRTEGY